MKAERRRIFHRLLPYVKRQWPFYLVGFISLAIVDAAQMVIPQLIRLAIDKIAGGRFRLAEILYLAGAIVIIAGLISVGRFLWRFFIHGASRKVETAIRNDLFQHLLKLSSSFYQQTTIGDLMARATNDLNAVRTAVGMGLVTLVDGSLMAAGILTIMFVQHPQVSLLAVIPLPLITLIMVVFGKLIGKRFKRVQEIFSTISSLVQETFAGIRVIKSFVKEDWFAKKFTAVNEQYRAANMALVGIHGFFFPLIGFLSGLTSLILLLAGGSRVLDGQMTAGELLALFSYLQMLIWPMLGAGFTVNIFQRGTESLIRINEILQTQPDIVSPVQTVPVDSRLTTGPVIEFRKLYFAYPGGDFKLQNISLSLKAGSVLGILGRTGSGKSTLLKLLPRLIDPPAGSVFVYGVDVRAWDLSQLRQSLAFVPQDNYLFSDSLKNNIAYGAAELTEAALLAAAEASTITRDLADFKDGWDSVIGERGLSLSGGQKQRVALSRALVRESPILVLDDAFAAVDSATEDRILTGLLELANRPAIIMVSNRISTLQRADQVLVLKEGQVLEYGRPDELLAKASFFAETAELQRISAAVETSSRLTGQATVVKGGNLG